MTITKDQAQMIAALAADSRPNGATRWDHAGIMTALERIRHWSLPEAIAETITAAADKDAETPGVIGRQGRSWASVRAVTVDSAPVGTRCTVCGAIEKFHHTYGHVARDHEFSRPHEAPEPAEVAARVAALKAELAPTSQPTGHRSPEDLAEANPELHDRLEKVRAMIPDAATREAEA